MDTKLLHALTKDRTMNMEQKLLWFLMLSKPEHLPNNPNVADHTELGRKLKALCDSGTIRLSLDADGKVCTVKTST